MRRTQDVRLILEKLMKSKILVVLSLLSLLSIGAKNIPDRLIRLTLVNKSGMAIDLVLTGSERDMVYYLRMPVGTRSDPLEQVYTIVPDYYQASLAYVELWDPVYGYTCNSRSSSLDASHNLRVVVLECDRRVRGGEPPAVIKFGASGR